MFSNVDTNYIRLLVLHAIIAVLIYITDFFSKVYFIAILIFFVYRIFTVKPNKRHVEVVVACSYLVAAEVFVRMTGGAFSYEASKYMVIMFLLLGLFFSNFDRKAYPFSIYLILLMPSIIISAFTLDITTSWRRAVAFNLAGPVCLGIAALFCYGKKISLKDLHSVVLALLLPVVSNMIFLFLYTPSVRDSLRGTQSNYIASGGFGPNQVSTALGIGMIALIIKFVAFSKDTVSKVITLILFGLVSFRAFITFSRGGVIVAIIAILAFLVLFYLKLPRIRKPRFLRTLIVLIVFGAATWIFTSIQTMGFIDKRYTNRDAAGRLKSDITTGRAELISTELDEFFNNPFFGLGAGKVKEERLESTGIHAASHNEMSRILAEHGLLGVIALGILIFAPLLWRSKNRSNYAFFSFYLFWLLTINHSSMRIAAPAFIYALCLLDIQYGKPIIHRKQIS